MPSDAAKRRKENKRAKNQAAAKERAIKGQGHQVTNGNSETASNQGDTENEVNNVVQEVKSISLSNIKTSPLSSTGVLQSHPESRDLKIGQFSVIYQGIELIQDALLELSCGNRYGFVGPNGSGKSTVMRILAEREVPIPDHMDLFHVVSEMPPSETTPLQAVMEVDEERARLEEEASRLQCLIATDGETTDLSNALTDVYQRLEDMDADTAETNAARILCGLGFNYQMMSHKQLKDFSGGWRMRVSLARALFIRPHILLLDEPTNHLDLEACVWLEEELKKYRRILLLVSHSQDFLNGVCTHIIHLHRKKLRIYGGNYDTYVSTRLEKEANQMKRYKKEQDQIAHMKDYVARFGHGSAKLARQAQSKEKVLAKMVAGGLTERIALDHTVQLFFPDCGELPPPVLQMQKVSFRYGPDLPLIYDKLELYFDLDSRVALVGPNGAGKSTLIKLLAGELIPSEGQIRRHSHLKMGRYNQHLVDVIDVSLSPVDFLMKAFPEYKERDEMRKMVGRYGLTGKQQLSPISLLSDGQKCRVAFAWLSMQCPHMLLLDEPTNHLDIETIDSLAYAINAFSGGLVLISHDFRLISQVADEIWVCQDKKVTKWDGDIHTYKDTLKNKVLRSDRKAGLSNQSADR